MVSRAMCVYNQFKTLQWKRSEQKRTEHYVKWVTGTLHMPPSGNLSCLGHNPHKMCETLLRPPQPFVLFLSPSHYCTHIVLFLWFRWSLELTLACGCTLIFTGQQYEHVAATSASEGPMFHPSHSHETWKLFPWKLERDWKGKEMRGNKFTSVSVYYSTSLTQHLMKCHDCCSRNPMSRYTISTQTRGVEQTTAVLSQSLHSTRSQLWTCAQHVRRLHDNRAGSGWNRLQRKSICQKENCEKNKPEEERSHVKTTKIHKHILYE